MPRRDAIHEDVCAALRYDGWIITHDPYTLEYATDIVHIDVGAERLIAATRGMERIAVEIKTFAGRSVITDAQQAIGQYVFYRDLLAQTEPERILYLAIADTTASILDLHPTIGLVVQKQHIRLIVINTTTKEIVAWT